MMMPKLESNDIPSIPNIIVLTDTVQRGGGNAYNPIKHCKGNLTDHGVNPLREEIST